MIVLFIISGILFIAAIGGMFRNVAVFKERTRVGNIVSDLANIDIHKNHAWEWRYAELQSITYDEMMLKFWKPVQSFYAGKDLINSKKWREK